MEIINTALSNAHETITKTRVVCNRQQLCRLDREPKPKFYEISPECIANSIAPAMHDVDAIIISDYAKGTISTESVRAIQTIAQDGIFMAMDPKPRSLISYSGMSVMTPNRPESLKLAGIECDETDTFPAEDVFRNIYEKFSPAHLVVTLGAGGMLISGDGGLTTGEHIPTVAREVFDVTGAGDTVIAALTLASVAGASLEDAARFANTAAGFVVGKMGSATATPDDIRNYATGCNK